jgi:hypothetical protein
MSVREFPIRMGKIKAKEKKLSMLLLFEVDSFEVVKEVYNKSKEKNIK